MFSCWLSWLWSSLAKYIVVLVQYPDGNVEIIDILKAIKLYQASFKQRVQDISES